MKQSEYKIPILETIVRLGQNYRLAPFECSKAYTDRAFLDFTDRTKELVHDSDHKLMWLLYQMTKEGEEKW